MALTLSNVLEQIMGTPMKQPHPAQREVQNVPGRVTSPAPRALPMRPQEIGPARTEGGGAAPTIVPMPAGREPTPNIPERRVVTKPNVEDMDDLELSEYVFGPQDLEL